MTLTQSRYVFISSLISFILIAVFIYNGSLQRLDEKIVSFFQLYTPSFIKQWMEIITAFGSGEIILFITVIICVFLFFKKWWGYLFYCIFITFGGIIVNLLLKFIFQRERPGEISTIDVFGYSLQLQSYSFPSGHTMRTTLLLLFLISLLSVIIVSRTKQIIATVAISLLIIIIGLSRVIVGAHFPSDIIAAIVISITWFSICHIIMHRYIYAKKRLPS